MLQIIRTINKSEINLPIEFPSFSTHQNQHQVNYVSLIGQHFNEEVLVKEIPTHMTQVTNRSRPLAQHLPREPV